MSTASLPSASLSAGFAFPTKPSLVPFELARARPKASSVVRRRPDRVQGLALERIGHAIEYLVDARMFTGDDFTQAADAEAVQILSCLSRAVFAECTEIVPVRNRLRNWLGQFAVGV